MPSHSTEAIGGIDDNGYEALSDARAIHRDDELLSMHAQILQLELRHATLNEELCTAKIAVTRLTDSEAKQRERASEALSQLETARRDSQRSHDLENQCRSLAARLSESEHRVRALDSLLAVTEQERDETQRRHQQQLRAKDEALKRSETELREVSAKHRQEWRERDDQHRQIIEENEILRRNIANLGDENEKIQSLNAECARLDKHVKQLVREHETDVQSLSQRLADTEAMLASERHQHQSSITELDQQLSLLKDQLSEQIDAADINEKYIDKQSEEIGLQQKLNEELKTKYSQMSQKNQQMEKMFREEQNCSVDSLTKLRKEFDHFHSLYESHVTDYQRQLAAYRAQVQQLVQRLHNDSGNDTESKENVDSGGGERKSVYDELCEALSQVIERDATILALQARLTNESTNSRVSPVLMSMTATMGSTHAMSNSSERLIKRRSFTSKMPSRMSSSPTQSQAHSAVHDSATEVRDCIVLSARLAHLTAQLSHANQQLQHHRDRLTQAESQASLSQSQAQQYQRRATECQHQLSNERRSIKEREIEIEHSLKRCQVIERRCADFEEVNRQLSECKVSLKSQREENSRKRKLLNLLQSELKESQAKCQSATDELTARERRVASLIKQLQSKELLLSEWKKKFDDSEHTSENFRSRAQKTEASLAERIHQLELLASERDSSITALRFESESLRVTIAEMQLVSDKHCDSENKLSLCHNEIQLLNQTIQSLDSANGNASRKVAELEQRVASMTAEMRATENQLIETRTNHSKLLELLDSSVVVVIAAIPEWESLNERQSQRATTRPFHRSMVGNSSTNLPSAVSLSQAARAAGLDFSTQEVESLMRAASSPSPPLAYEASTPSTLSARHLRAEWSNVMDRARRSSSVDTDWIRYASEVVVHIGNCLASLQSKVTSLLSPASIRPASPSHSHSLSASASSVDSMLLSRYESIIREIKAELADQQRQHDRTVALYEARLRAARGTPVR